MNRIFSRFLLFGIFTLFFIGCKEISDGKTSLIDIITEPEGENCSSGGYKIISGIDLNGNSILESNEIQDTEYICHGQDGENGKNYLLNIIVEPSGQNCNTGGYRIISGLDLDGNERLDSEEGKDTVYLCNGLTGRTTVFNIVEETVGDNCQNGGYKIFSGMDTNLNNVLDMSEIQDTTFICNGKNARDGYNSILRILEEAPGEACYNGGYKIITGIDTDNNGELSMDEIQQTKYICFTNEDKYIQTNFNHHILDGYIVTSIAFDSEGNAWIGTSNKGLIKYNESETIIFNTTNSAIALNAVGDIAIDSEDNIWFASNGLNKFDGIEFTHFDTTNSPMPENNVTSIAIDSDNNIWFSSCVNLSGGIVKYDNINWEIFTPENSLLPAHLINDIEIDINDNVWVTSYSQTITKISESIMTTQTLDNLNGAHYFLGDISISKYNEVYIIIVNGATSGGISECQDCSRLIELKDYKVYEFFIDDILLTLHTLYVDNNKNIWGFESFIGHTLVVFNGAEWKTIEIDLNTNIYTISQAINGEIWLGTTNGIYTNKL